ncbi:MAG: AAA family ATPase [Planctomycetota bacterium]
MTRINSIRFQNFRCLRDCVLPLERMTLLIGPNGSGKSTALLALEYVGRLQTGRANLVPAHSAVAHAGGLSQDVAVELSIRHPPTIMKWAANTATPSVIPKPQGQTFGILSGIRLHHLDARVLVRPSKLARRPALGAYGENLPAILDYLRGEFPERFDGLQDELTRWLPEYDRILLPSTDSSEKGFALRTTGGHTIDATYLSEGTVLALALLTIVWLPEPPSVLCLEEPDRGIHPRLLKDVQQALYRLTHPEAFGETRPPVQVIATTHCPYLLDLYRDHPEEVVVASKDGLDVSFKRLVDIPNYEFLVRDSHLGEAWYSGVLGGVPQ